MVAERSLDEWEKLKPNISRVRIMDDPVRMLELCRARGYNWSDRVHHMNGNVYTVIDNIEERQVYLVYDPVTDTNNVQQGKIFIPWMCVLVLDEDIDGQYAVAVGKAAVGAIRFGLESVVQSSGQGLFLIKMWRTMPWSSRLFTISSIAASLLLSILGPVREYILARSFKRKLRDMDYQQLRQPPIEVEEAAPEIKIIKLEFAEDLSGTIDEKIEAIMKENNIHRSRWDLHYVRSGDGNAVEEFDDAVLRDADQFPLNLAFKKKSFNKTSRFGTGPLKCSLETFLQGDGGQSIFARRALIVSNVVFWGAMAYIFFGINAYDCATPPPAGATLVFGFAAVPSLLVELWVAVHSLRGYTMLVYKSRMTLLNIALTMMAKYDTYGDITSVRIIEACDPITWVSVKGHRFDLHCELARVMLIALIGVLVLQVFPFLYLLATRKHFLIAAKLGELNVLLATMENEAKEPGN